MPNLAEIVHRRRERRADLRRRSESRVRAAGLGLGYIFSILLAVGIFASVFAYADLTRDLPSIDQLPILLNPDHGLLLQPTRLYDRTGEQAIFTFSPSVSARVYLPLDRLPKSLVDATIAAADTGFERHPGYFLSGLDNPDAHPTLAQKLVYDLLLFAEPPSLRRALRERILAAQITSRFGREQVMEWYINSANYGHYAFGIEAASELYFGKPASELTLAESALLAAVSQTPSLNPLDAPDAASQRGREMLLVMKALGMTDEVASLPSPVIGSPTGVLREGAGGEGESAFVNLVMMQLSSRYDRQRIERGGLNIITTLDYELQQNTICLTQIYAARLAGAPVDETGCEAARNLSALPQANLANPSASALVLDPRDGQILALVGETGPGGESAFLTAHKPGSLLAPFVYLTGFARGLGPASLVWDVPGGDIQNPDLAFHGPVRLRAALANDYLAPALDVLEQMGAGNAAQTARSFGLDLEPGAAFVSDSPPQTLTDLAAAYAIFAASGLRNGQFFADAIQPSSVLRVETDDGAVWLDWSQPESQSVVLPQLAYLMNHALSDGPARWPSWGNPNVTEIGRPAAVKSGWTGGPDAWTIGYTPARLVAVWTGGAGGGVGALAAPAGRVVERADADRQRVPACGRLDSAHGHHRVGRVRSFGFVAHRGLSRHRARGFHGRLRADSGRQLVPHLCHQPRDGLAGDGLHPARPGGGARLYVRAGPGGGARLGGRGRHPRRARSVRRHPAGRAESERQPHRAGVVRGGQRTRAIHRHSRGEWFPVLSNSSGRGTQPARVEAGRRGHDHACHQRSTRRVGHNGAEWVIRDPVGGGV